MDNVCYDEVIDFVKRGHQVLVFVHTRNGTAKLGEAFCARASVLGQMDLFLPKDKTSSKYVQADKAINKCRNRFQISPLFQRGFGIHHVGLCRQDRILMERCFAEGHISVLFCTTLVWRVNLPAHAVVIKGTDVFDAEKGVFTDLDVLDVQQIFGRAGLPQFENEGHGIIITTRDKIDKYLTMLVHQNPIESNFYTRLHDNLNAEVALGTVSTVDEGVKWLTYTYMYTRAVKNPVAYGIAYNAIERDPNLRDHFGNVIREAAMQLDQNEMIRFDLATECLNSTDLGRIASNFYVKYETIQLLNEAEKGVGLPVTFTAFMPDDMVIGLISMATEFANIKCREEEIGDLEELMSYGCMMNVRGGGLASVAGKVNVLLQSLISRTSTRNLALMSEQLYVQQNAGRLCRAMFEMVLKNRWSQAANAFLGIAKCVEKQMWMNQCPLRQFIQKIDIPITWIEKIERKKARESDLLELSPKVLGYLFSCDGDRLYTYLRYLPRMGVKARSKPNTCNMLQVIVTVTPAFIWNDTIHGKSGLQSFFLVLENLNENLIIHQERFGIGKKKVMRKKPQFIVFTIPIVDCQLTNNFRLRLASEYFVTEDVVVPLSLQNCILSKSSKVR
uniref:SEC63 domain-containing protein n=1 Tax=Caenorhabditis tropicalis TaxID=1561998 RepID=A0A1I7T7W5_9PELO